MLHGFQYTHSEIAEGLAVLKRSSLSPKGGKGKGGGGGGGGGGGEGWGEMFHRAHQTIHDLGGQSQIKRYALVCMCICILNTIDLDGGSTGLQGLETSQ